MTEDIRKSEYNNITISIIVATYNSAATLQHCLDSIDEQTYPYKELIVMDGGSTDGTVDILEKNTHKVTYWESAPDRGIYHAWNKAVQCAQGDYICFLGADDYWAKCTSIEVLVKVAINNQFPDFISGKVAIVNNNYATIRIVGDAWHPAKMRKWMVVAHPGMLHHKKIFQSFGIFSEKYAIAGDYEFLLRCNEKSKSVFVDDVLVYMRDGGLSSKSKSLVLYETLIIQATHKKIGFIWAFMNFSIAWLKYIARKTMKFRSNM